MQKNTKPRRAALNDAKLVGEPNNECTPHRVAYTPAEFAALFGRSGTWGYRQLYSGRVKALQVSGRLLIPRSEVDRLLAEATVYDGQVR